MSYKVYLITSESAPRQHKSIFVETHQEGPGSGYLFHVVGSVAARNGMERGDRPEVKPEESLTCPFAYKYLLGEVSLEDYDARFKALCDEAEVPKKQYQLSKRLYPNEKVRRCGDWVEDAVKRLREEGVLVEAERGEGKW